MNWAKLAILSDSEALFGGKNCKSGEIGCSE